MIYITHDADGDRIAENANIHAVASMDEAKQLLLSAYDPADWDVTGATISPGWWGDCWMKTHTPPDASSRVFQPFSENNLIVQSPGTHPGGNAYWITPSCDVFVIAHMPAK